MNNKADICLYIDMNTYLVNLYKYNKQALKLKDTNSHVHTHTYTHTQSGIKEDSVWEKSRFWERACV